MYIIPLRRTIHYAHSMREPESVRECRWKRCVILVVRRGASKNVLFAPHSVGYLALVSRGQGDEQQRTPLRQEVQSRSRFGWVFPGFFILFYLLQVPYVLYVVVVVVVVSTPRCNTFFCGFFFFSLFSAFFGVFLYHLHLYQSIIDAPPCDMHHHVCCG